MKQGILAAMLLLPLTATATPVLWTMTQFCECSVDGGCLISNGEFIFDAETGSYTNINLQSVWFNRAESPAMVRLGLATLGEPDGFVPSASEVLFFRFDGSVPGSEWGGENWYMAFQFDSPLPDQIGASVTGAFGLGFCADSEIGCNEQYVAPDIANAVTFTSSTPRPVPEPAAFALLALGLLSLAAVRRRAGRSVALDNQPLDQNGAMRFRRNNVGWLS